MDMTYENMMQTNIKFSHALYFLVCPNPPAASRVTINYEEKEIDQVVEQLVELRMNRVRVKECLW